MQEQDRHELAESDLKVVTRRAPTREEIEAMLFGWKVCKHVKSNAIVFARAGQTVGIGAGQMSRVDSVKIAVMKAQLPLAGSVVASDAFFPFPRWRRGSREGRRHRRDPAGRLGARCGRHRGCGRAGHGHGVQRRAAFQALRKRLARGCS